MKNILKKMLVCGVSLIMITSLGTGINNVSAKRMHRHNRPRIHRIAISSHALYKQGERDSSNYADENTLSYKAARKIYKRIINKLIKAHFNKSYIKGLNLIKPNKNGGFAGESNDLHISILSDAKKVAHHHSNRSKHIRKSSYKYYRKNKRNNRYMKKSIRNIHRNSHKRHVRTFYRK